MSTLILDPNTQLVTVEDSTPSISVLWDRAVQQAVINTSPGPTIASRAYGILHTAMFDAWASYDPTAVPSLSELEFLQGPEANNTDLNKTEAMSFAAYRVLSELFPSEVETFDALMAELGFDPSNTAQNAETPAGIGNTVAETLMAFRREDGSNQLNGFVDNSGYQPLNLIDESRADITRWTGERVPIDAATTSEADRVQDFLTPQWGQVTPFALETGDQFRPVAPQPFWVEGFEESVLNFEAGTITLPDGSTVDVSQELIGEVINPGFVSQAEDVVNVSANLTDEQKLVAEFWEDGGGTSFPPGTWLTFGQFVSARDENTLDEDAVLFFALGNAVFDAGIATWEAKVTYDYLRPVRAIRDLGELGLIGELGVDEVTGEEGFVVEAWSPTTGGTRTILAENFLTYQTPGSDPSPPFAEYTSGHSSFSAAGATILSEFTGSDVFGGSVTFQPGESRFEPDLTPSSELTLEWDTFTGAADEAGISRIYGGIHFDEGDLNGRQLGRDVGQAVWDRVQFLVNGGEEESRDPLTLFGTDAAETLVGQAGDDIIYGNGGADVIDSGAGIDQVWLGGASEATVILSEGEGYDFIANFQEGNTQLQGFAASELTLRATGSVDIAGIDAFGVEIFKGDDLLAVVGWKTVEMLDGAFVA